MKAGLGRNDARLPLRVLIVEDSENDALLLLRELERGGYEPMHERVDTPEELRRALAEGGPWDVVLSDWRMPRFEAPEALAMFHATGSEAPFIIVSGKVGEELAVEGMKAGAHDYVMKDNLTRLCATVERGLQEAQARLRSRRAEEERDRLFEFSPDLLCVAGVDGYFKRVNPAFEETLGYSSRELLAKPFIEFVHPEDRAATMSELKYLGRGVRTAYFENRYLRKDDSQVWLEWKAVPVVEEDVIYATARDVTERKRTGEALAQSEERYRAVVEQAAEGIFLFDAATGGILESNAAFQELLGYTAQELLGMKLYDLVAHEWEGIDRNIQRILDEGSRFVGERRYRCKDGSLVDVEVTASLISYGGKKVICTVIRDVTERKRAERALRQSEQLYRTVIEQAAEYIYLIDTETRHILQSNPACREALGYTREELGHMTLYDIVAHDRESIDRNARRVLERGRYFVGERKYRRKDGSLIDVETSSSTILYDGREVFCVVGHDVTERKRAEEEIKQERDFSSAVIDTVGALVGVFDSEGRIVRFNRACERLSGYTFEEVRGRYFWELFLLPEEVESVKDVAREITAGQFPNSNENYWMVRDGSLRLISWHNSALLDERGEVAYIIATGIDITERKQAEEALAQSEERYRAVVEQAAEGIFLCDAATGQVLESNTAFRELLGYTAGELRGIKIHDLIDDEPESIDSNLQLILDEGSRFLGERRYRRKDGSLVDVEATATVISYGGRKVICDVIRDVTERVEAFRMLEERVTALAGISASLTVGQTMEATLDALAAGVVQSTAAVACAVVLVDEETNFFRTAGSYGLPEGYTASLETAYRAGMRPPPVEVFRKRRPMLIRDARQTALNTPFSYPLHRFLHEVTWDTIYFVPLVYQGRALGILSLYYLPEQEPSEDESVFLGAVADQTAVAVENARLFAAAQGKAALEERQRLARELHDSVSQALYGIALGSRTARSLLDREDSPDRVDEWLEYVLSLAEAGLTEMRALIFELRPESLQTEGLIAALKQQAAALKARYEIAVHATLGEEPDLPLDTKETLYRIAQEALHNIAKHARASRADLKLERDAGGIALEVSDDGAGFDPEGSYSGRLGLKSMRERVAHLGGTLRIESAPGEGTRVRAQIPPGT